MRTFLLLVAIGAAIAAIASWIRAIMHMRPGAPRWKAFASWTVGDHDLYDEVGRRAIRYVSLASIVAIVAFVGRLFVR